MTCAQRQPCEAISLAAKIELMCAEILATHSGKR
jgi:hypothetical protein